MPPKKRGRPTGHAGGDHPAKVAKTDHQQQSLGPVATQKGHTGLVTNDGSDHDTMDSILKACKEDSTLSSQEYNAPGGRITLVLGLSQLQLLRLHISQRFKDETTFCEYFGIETVDIPRAQNEFIECYVTLEGLDHAVARSSAYITYYLHNYTQLLLQGGALSTYTATVLYNKYHLEALEKPLAEHCELAFGCAKVSASSVVLVDFSSHARVILTGHLMSVLRSIAYMSHELRTVADDRETLPEPVSIRDKYLQNGAHGTTMGLELLRALHGKSGMVPRELLGNIGDLGQVIYDKSALDSIFQRVPFLGVFQDPDTILKGEEKDETAAQNAALVAESSKAMSAHIEHLQGKEV